MVIDDDDDIREVATMSLQLVGGHQVITASSGMEGFRRAAEERPDAILLDVMMPQLDGPATVAQLQADERTSDIDVILLTAKVQHKERSRYHDLAGVVGVIAKPFDPMSLSQQVADILGWPSS